MTVIEIREDNHGFIGCALDYKSAVQFLIREGWLEDNDEFYDEEEGRDIELYFSLGEDWQEVLMDWDINKFNDYFDGYLYLEEEEVYEYDEDYEEEV